MGFPPLPEYVRVLLKGSNGAWMDGIIGEARLQREHRLKWSLLECCLERRGLYDGQTAVVPYPGNRAQTHHNDDTGRLPSLTPCLLLQSAPGSVGPSPARSHCSIDAPACDARCEVISREPLCLQEMRLFCSALRGGEFFWN